MNFKKHISILLAFFLLVSNSGLAFNVHYCGDEIASISLRTPVSSQNTEKDCCGIIEKKSRCCKDKVFHFQKKSDNLILKAFAFNSDFAVLIDEWNPIVFSAKPNFKSRLVNSYFCDAHAPPLFKLYHQYIFYA